MREVFEKNGVKITRAIPVKTLTDTSGYILQLDGNGYDFLKPYTLKVK